ncbi:MAG: cobalt-precorrin-5B (C(1))-methyltransferase [Mesorhizobium sp.]
MKLAKGFARAAIVKDAGDDPDVTHGALIVSTVRHGPEGSGISFLRGEGVGLVTRPGLPIAPGEPAINPVPRRMIAQAVAEVAGKDADISIEISVPEGEAMAVRTLNGRLGILHGISILGTTGIVIPYSCSSWIHSIHRGIDVARAMGFSHVAGSTGNASELAVQKRYDMHEVQLIDMGDFVGGMLKYIAKHPVPRVTIAGGVAKMTKLAQGMLDLHSKRGPADMEGLAAVAGKAGASASLVVQMRSGQYCRACFRTRSRQRAFRLVTPLRKPRRKPQCRYSMMRPSQVEVLVFDRDGNLRGQFPRG